MWWIFLHSSLSPCLTPFFPILPIFLPSFFPILPSFPILPNPSFLSLPLPSSFFPSFLSLFLSFSPYLSLILFHRNQAHFCGHRNRTFCVPCERGSGLKCPWYNIALLGSIWGLSVPSTAQPNASNDKIEREAFFFSLNFDWFVCLVIWIGSHQKE